MSEKAFVSPDEIRIRFSRAMSDMYRREVPQYGTLMALVSDVNGRALERDPGLRERLSRAGELDRIDLERHGAIRLGTANELATMRRLFAVMGMVPVGYYDLSVAGVPVHSTAFRPVDDEALARNPFRVFTSLLRLELVEGEDLRAEAEAILDRRRIFTDGALRLIDRAEAAGGLRESDVDAFVTEAIETFRWHGEATVDAGTYLALSAAHRLVADVVCFKGPHINHLTPRTLDIDAVQADMPKRGIAAKAVVEGPPSRRAPILLRQTSFKALEEPIAFRGEAEAGSGTHTARFGEVEQRGIALTREGRALYDELLASVRGADGSGSAGAGYEARLAKAFEAFPDSYDEIRRRGLGFFRYALTATGAGQAASLDGTALDGAALDALVDAGHVSADPIVYEDFLPVSAAGIFQSNLGGTEQRSYGSNANRRAFEQALGAAPLDEMALYAAAERRSVEALHEALREAAREAARRGVHAPAA